MGAVVVADPGDEARTGARRRYAVPALLILGWVCLFAYSAAYLTEDLPFRSPPADRLQSAEGVRPHQGGRRLVTLDARNDAAPEAPGRDGPPGDGPRDTQGTATGGIPAALSAPMVAPLAAAPVSRPPSPAVSGADYVGLWGPTAFACGAPSRRRGYIPATISPDHARAGRTRCSFHDGRRTGETWIMAAECSDRGRRWSSQVRLHVEGDRMTWSSSRGTTSYVRCGRRAG